MNFEFFVKSKAEPIKTYSLMNTNEKIGGKMRLV
jgi:hypothetical protein